MKWLKKYATFPFRYKIRILGPIIDSKFSIKSATCIQKGMLVQTINHKVNNKMWKLNILPKVKMFAWLFFRERLQTRKRLGCILANTDRKCPFCNLEEKDQIHLFVKFNVTRLVWNLVSVNPIISNPQFCFCC